MARGLAKLYNEALFDTDRERAIQIVHQAVEEGVSPEEVLFKIIVPGIDFLAELACHEGSINLAQHFMAAQIAEFTAQEMLAQFKYAPEI
jgi:trimethylamine corrinoid protein